MYNYGKASQGRLDTCHQDIQLIFTELIKIYDVSIIEGLRTTEKQQWYFHSVPPRTTLDGITKLSKHQDHGDGVSHAVDVMPYKKGTNAFSGKKKDLVRFYYMAGLIKGVASRLLNEGKITHGIRWGGDWNGNDVYSDQNFDDLPHFELVNV